MTGITGCRTDRKIKFHGGWLFTDPREEQDVYANQQGIHTMMSMAGDDHDPAGILDNRRVTSRYTQPRKRVGNGEGPEVQGFASRMPSYGSRMRRSAGVGEVSEQDDGDVVMSISTRGSRNTGGVDESGPSL